MVRYPEVRRGDIWLADLGRTTGSEQGGVRPVIVLQNNKGNIYSPTVIVAALTGRHKKYLPTHTTLDRDGNRLWQNSTVLLEQIRTIDRARLLKRLGALNDAEMREADEALTVSVGLTWKDGGL